MNYYRLIFTTITVITLLSLGACASKGINLVKSGDLSIETSGSNNIKIVDVRVKQLENEVLIHADVKPVKAVRFFSPGHLSFELFMADGNQFFDLDVTRYSNKHSDGHRSKMKHASFWVRMPLDIPKGSKLKVTHHSRSVHERKVK